MAEKLKGIMRVRTGRNPMPDEAQYKISCIACGAAIVINGVDGQQIFQCGGCALSYGKVADRPGTLILIRK